MKREFLKDLKIEALTEEVINKIMTEHGKTVEAKKTEIETLKTENETLKGQMSETNIKLKEFEGMDIDGIKKASKELEEKFENEKKELETRLEKQNYNHIVDGYLSKLTFSNDYAKKGFKSEFVEKGFKLEDGKLLGADDFVKIAKEKSPSTFSTQSDKNLPDFGSTTDKDKGRTKEDSFVEKLKNSVIG